MYEPYGQWLRYHPSRVHPNFETIQGYPFTKQGFSTIADVVYNQPEEYEDIFQTTQLGHWQLHALCKLKKFSDNIPDVRQSIFAGT